MIHIPYVVGQKESKKEYYTIGDVSIMTSNLIGNIFHWAETDLSYCSLSHFGQFNKGDAVV